MSILPLFIPHAGCPHQCVFCNQKTISGQKKPALEGAKEQLERWLEWFKPSPEQEAAFYGGSFTALDRELQEQLLSLTDDLIKSGVIGRVRLSTRPDCISEDELCLLKAHNVHLVELGVQSLDNKVLEAAERGHKAEAVIKAMGLLQQAGFKTGIQLMVGMPCQSFDSVKETVEQVIALKPDIARIYPLLVIKDTPLAKKYATGQFEPLSLEEAVEQAAYVYDKLTTAGIKVIRIGLQADEELCTPGNIVAGPFHPSMGELVKSRVLLNRLKEAILSDDEDLTGQIESPEGEVIHFELKTTQENHKDPKEHKEHKEHKDLLLHCNPKLHSQLMGMKKANYNYLKQKNIYLKFI